MGASAFAERRARRQGEGVRESEEACGVEVCTEEREGGEGKREKKNFRVLLFVRLWFINKEH